MKKIAVIVAGGNGSRMNAALPKQFLMLRSKPVLYYTIDTFLRAYIDLDVIVVLPADHLEAGKKMVDEYFSNSSVQLTTGGQTRFHSVQNGLQLISEESIVFVHDGVRCLLSTNLIQRCYDAAVEFGTAIPAIDSKDSIRVLSHTGNESLERSTVKLVQTPQTFHSKILIPAFNIEYRDTFTDEATVVEASGVKVHLVEGEENNIKITKPVDLVIAEQLIGVSK